MPLETGLCYFDCRLKRKNATPAKMILGIQTAIVGLSVDFAEKVVESCMNIM